MPSSYQTYTLSGKEYTVGGSHRGELAEISAANPALAPLVEQVMGIADFAAVLVQAGYDLGLVNDKRMAEPGQDLQKQSRDRDMGRGGPSLKF